MRVLDQLASLLLTAERASSDCAVTVDVFLRGDAGRGDGQLAPMWSAPGPIGRVVAERGRICWVTSKRSSATVSDLLAAETGFPRSQLEEVYEAAKTEGAPFCETLAEAGLVSPEEVRRALRTKAAAAAADLASVQAREAVAVSIARIPLPSYEERFTFAGLEILQAAVMESKELEQATMTLPPTFASMGPGLPAALCFREWEESELPLLPISCCSSDSMSISEALEMALSGLAATQPSDPLMAEISPFALLTRGGSEHWLCAYDPPDLCLFQIHTRAHYHDLLEALLVQRRVRDRGPTPSAAAKSSHGCGA